MSELYQAIHTNQIKHVIPSDERKKVYQNRARGKEFIKKGIRVQISERKNVKAGYTENMQVRRARRFNGHRLFPKT